eukprot:4815292-Pyramimonas_sp.AAC.1
MPARCSSGTTCARAWCSSTAAWCAARLFSPCSVHTGAAASKPRPIASSVHTASLGVLSTPAPEASTTSLAPASSMTTRCP